MSINRRQFVQGSAALGAATGLSLVTSARSYANVMGSNNKLQMAVIGFASRGRALIGAVNSTEDARLIALCDADSNILADYKPDDQELFRTDDFREILSRDDIDAVASATPNHWHALLTILACQAGKHVYIEKPISHNMMESRAIVKVARETDRIVQCGFQNRSDSGCTSFFEKLREGHYGTVTSVHGTCHRERESIGKLDEPLELPDHINYELWLGPARDEPLMRPGFHYDWHWDFNTGNGDVGNQGPHEWDMMNWALGDPEALPTRMVSAGNRFGWQDAGNTPNIMACAGELNGIPFCFEVMDLKGGRGAPFGRGVGVIVETDKGRFVGGRGSGQFTWHDGREDAFSRDESQDGQDGLNAHMINFVEGALAGDRSNLRSECAVAANSSSMAHMANISYQLGQAAEVDELEAAFSDDVRQRDMLARLRESTMLYAVANGGELPAESWILGPALEFDNDRQQFIGENASSANAKTTREYRDGFEVPAN
ncbi:MAG: Gfo/Idh/MocA family oxidoreductase [Pirellulaceae bacterium]